jgi:hypothetical protein
MTVESHAVAKPMLELLPKVITQNSESVHLPEIACKLTRLTEPDRKQCTLSTRAPAMLVSGTVNQRFQRYVSAHEQSADTFGCIEFVAGNRQKIDTELIHIGRNLASRLRGIGVKENAVLVGDSGAFGHRLDGPDLVVGVHDADKDRSRRNRSANVIGVNSSCAVNRQIGYTRA